MTSSADISKEKLVEIVDYIIEDVKTNEGMGIARLLADNKLITEEEYDQLVT